MSELAKRIAAHPYRAMGLAFALGLSIGMRGRKSTERGIAAAAFAGAVALGLRMLRNVAVDQVIAALKAEAGFGPETAAAGAPGAAAAASKDSLVH